MGLGAKIKNALHGDSHTHSHNGPASSYGDGGRLPGSFPSEGLSNNATSTSTAKPTSPTTTSNNLNTTHRNSTLKKASGHQKADSGVDFVDSPGSSSTKAVVHNNDLTGADPHDQRPVSREGGIGAIDDPTASSSNKSDPYWGNIKSSGYEKDLPHRPVNQVERDLKTIENGTYGSSLDGVGLTHGNLRSSNAGPHPSHMMNKVDPRIDPVDHGAAAHGTHGHHSLNSHGSMLDTTTDTQGLGSTSHGHRSSSMPNKADSRYDSGLDRRGAAGYGSTGDGITGGISGMSGRTGMGRDMHEPHLTTHGGSTAGPSESNGRRSDLHNVGLVQANEPIMGDHHDERLRARDNGYSPVDGGIRAAGLGNRNHADLADRHHHDDLREAGLYNEGTSHHHTEGPTNSADKNSVMYGRSASTRNSPQRGSFGHGVGGSLTQGQQQNGANSSHFVPRVMHTCTSCGEDNDISRYFRSDVSYRLG